MDFNWNCSHRDSNIYFSGRPPSFKIYDKAVVSCKTCGLFSLHVHVSAGVSHTGVLLGRGAMPSLRYRTGVGDIPCGWLWESVDGYHVSGESCWSLGIIWINFGRMWIPQECKWSGCGRCCDGNWGAVSVKLNSGTWSSKGRGLSTSNGRWMDCVREDHSEPYLRLLLRCISSVLSSFRLSFCLNC